MAWTPWKKVADKLFWYTDHPIRVPICYELALADPADLDALRTVYVGAGAGEHRVLGPLERGETPLAGRLQAALAEGSHVYMRSVGAPTLEAAERLQADRLASGDYPWNDEPG